MKNYLSKIRSFLRVEEGLVAVEWVALASGLVIGAFIAGVIVMEATADDADLIIEDISVDAPVIVNQAT